MKELENKKVLKMKEYIAHSDITVYDHCLSVMKMSLLISDKLHIKVERKELLRGALLHDFYLYDWHDLPKPKSFFELHGFTHSKIALENATKEFDLSEREKNIIASHMFPLTLTKVPKCREAWIVCIADKIVATKETFKKYKRA